VRELENAIERAVALARIGHMEIGDLIEDVRRWSPTLDPSSPVKELEQIEREHILAVLDRNQGNQTKTAEQLGIGSATLYRKLKKYEAIRVAVDIPGRAQELLDD
jgi:transcriptional regulator of acetoin/glycerol metabolism